GLIGSLATAQLPSDPHLVATHLPGSDPATQIMAVDAVTGVVTGMGRFDGDTLPPCAFAIDPYDGHLLIALDQGDGTSPAARIFDHGATTLVLAVVPGLVSHILVQADWLVFASDDPSGGIYHLPRRGGGVSLVYAQANVTALADFGIGSTATFVAWSGRQGTPAPDPGVAGVGPSGGPPLPRPPAPPPLPRPRDTRPAQPP